jgi:hypothetical protein
MTPLPPESIGRLSRLLAMTTSSHDGEALNAIRMANALLKRQGMTWGEVLPTPLPADSSPAQPHHVEAETLLATRRDILTDFEADFLRGILAFETLSPKQETTLRGIRNKARQRPQ